ncbi:MAG: protein-glutamate O-methyltransferase CheR [Sphingomonas fennica]
MELTPAIDARLVRLLEERTGQQLAPNRRWRIEPALAAIMAEAGLADAAAVIHRIGRGDEALAQRVVEALLNHETSFYRDRAAFAQLLDAAIPVLAAARAASRRLRIWCAGCATGQEPYSLALGFHADPGRWAGWTIDIVGTDVSAAAIDRARQALYTQFEVQRGLPIHQLIAAFTPEVGSWRLADEVRRGVRFLRHSLLDPAPGIAFDLVLCRNVLLYFSPERRTHVFGRLASALAPDGLLMLGAGETVLGQSDAFVVDGELRTFYRPRGIEAEARVA